MNKEQLLILYPKLLAREVTDAELEVLYAYFQAGDLSELQEMIRRQLELEEPVVLNEDEIAQMDERVLGGLREMIAKEHIPPKRISIWPRIGIAAAAAAITLSIWLYYTPRHPDAGQDPALAIQNDIAPGKQGATLTLANGRKIRLAEASKGELANEAGVTITKDANGQLVYSVSNLSHSGRDGEAREGSIINTLSTSNGETYQLRLPDGSLVALNAASSLAYPANFTALKERRVKLTGEGYFEIAKDKAHPFIVETDRQSVKVLGTHFNVNAYADEPTIKTTLIEGAVKLSADQDNLILKPGEQAALTGNKFKVTQADVDEALAWKNGDFSFNGERIESVMRKLTRWYDIDVIYDGPVPDEEFYAEISKFRNISQVLAQLEKTKGAHFKIEGRRVIVSRFTK